MHSLHTVIQSVGQVDKQQHLLRLQTQSRVCVCVFDVTLVVISLIPPSLSLRLSIGQSPLTQQEKPVTLGEYLRQLSKHRNFMWFASMNLVQVFHCHFNNNFFPLFLEHLLSDSISASTGSILLGKRSTA